MFFFSKNNKTPQRGSCYEITISYEKHELRKVYYISLVQKDYSIVFKKVIHSFCKILLALFSVYVLLKLLLASKKSGIKTCKDLVSFFLD